VTGSSASIVAALLSALLFGASAPFAKILAVNMAPLLLAGTVTSSAPLALAAAN
jgi:anthranilate phosphoribosyltransferase